MPTIYRIEDSAETAKPGLDDSIAGAVLTDGRKTGRVVPGHYQALLLGDRIVPLPHPLEHSTLRSHNEGYLSASVKGILLQVEKRICLGCGTVFDAPSISFSPVTGCMLGIVAGFGVFAYARFAAHQTTIGALLLGWIAMCAVAMLSPVGDLCVRLCFARRQARIAQKNCPACGSLNSISVVRASGKRLSIGEDARWVQVSIAGMS